MKYLCNFFCSFLRDIDLFLCVKPKIKHACTYNICNTVVFKVGPMYQCNNYQDTVTVHQ